MEEPNYKEILDKKIEHYGNTQAAHEFAAQEYHKQMSKKEESYKNYLNEGEKKLNHYVELKRSNSWVVSCFPKPEFHLSSVSEQ